MYNSDLLKQYCNDKCMVSSTSIYSLPNIGLIFTPVFVFWSFKIFNKCNIFTERFHIHIPSVRIDEFPHCNTKHNNGTGNNGHDIFHDDHFVAVKKGRGMFSYLITGALTLSIVAGMILAGVHFWHRHGQKHYHKMDLDVKLNHLLSSLRRSSSGSVRNSSEGNIGDDHNDFDADARMSEEELGFHDSKQAADLLNQKGKGEYMEEEGTEMESI